MIILGKLQNTEIIAFATKFNPLHGKYFLPEDEYFKQYAIKLAKEYVARVVEKINSE